MWSEGNKDTENISLEESQAKFIPGERTGTGMATNSIHTSPQTAGRQLCILTTIRHC